MGLRDHEQLGGEEVCTETPIPKQVENDAQELNTMISTHETIPLDIDRIVADLGFPEDSPEANFLQESLTGLHTMMETMNTQAQQTASTLPEYFVNGGQMHMVWEPRSKHLTILSQGQEVLKFALERKATSGLSEYQPIPGEAKTLGISMKNLLIAPDTGKDNEIDLDQFMSFATEDGVASDRGLETFGSMYMDGMGYLAQYMKEGNRIVENQNTRNIVLGPQQCVKLVSPKVNSAEVTVNTLFAFPKPHVLTLTSPRGEQTIAYLQSNGTYLTETGSRPRIVQGTIVKNEMRFEDMQLAVENVYMQTGIPKTYSRDKLFPTFSQKSPAEQQAINAYMATFDNNEIQLESNQSGMRVYVDMSAKQGYVMHYELNNTYFNQPYNKDLQMPLAGGLSYEKGSATINEYMFTASLANQVEQIALKNFMQVDKKENTGIGRENFVTVVAQENVRSKPSTRYIEKRRNRKTGREYTMTKCSWATRETAQDVFGISLPDGNGLDAINKTPIDPAYAGEIQLSGKESLTEMGVQTMYDVLSTRLREGCTVVDIGYKSTGTNGKKYGHRNLAYYCYDSQERYINDPVTNYGGRGLSRYGIPLREAQTKMFFPYKMRFYKSKVGVYDKESEGVVS